MNYNKMELNQKREELDEILYREFRGRAQEFC